MDLIAQITSTEMFTLTPAASYKYDDYGGVTPGAGEPGAAWSDVRAGATRCQGRTRGWPPSPKLIACLLGLHLSNEGLRDASRKMACNRVNEFDEINVMIGFIRDGSNHNKRDSALVTHLSHRGTLHFDAECVR